MKKETVVSVSYTHLIYIVVFILSVISIAFKSEQYEYDDYIVVISGVLLCFGLKMQNNWKRWYFDYLLYSGGFVLVLYFVNTAVAHDMIPVSYTHLDVYKRQKYIWFYYYIYL